MFIWCECAKCGAIFVPEEYGTTDCPHCLSWEVFVYATESNDGQVYVIAQEVPHGKPEEKGGESKGNPVL